MQAYLDKWSPDPEALQTPKLGFTLDLSQAGKAIVAEVLAKSPAANAGLKVGDEIVELDAIPITTATSFALALRKISAENPVIITLISGHAVTITPATVPARRHFPAPVAGLIPMMIGNQAATSPPSIRELDRGFLAPLAALKESLKLSVIPIYQNRNLIVYATAVSGNQLLTKYSEIKEKEDLTFRLDEQESSVRLIAFDEKRDLALVSGTLQGLQPVGLQYNEAETGALLLTPLATQLITGVITQPARAVPALGYEHNVSPDDPSGYLGISLSPDEERPTVSSVALGSPADFGGLLEGDRIAQLGKTKVDSVEELSKLLKGYAPGDKVILKVARDNDILEIPLILDFRPATPADRKDRRAEMRDSSLASLTANGGKISQRRAGFPLAIYHDTRLRAQEMGTPLLDAEGKFLGLNIARALRQRTLAIPVNEIRNFFREERSRKSGTD
jgi:S1-C subfamily serine protease